MDLSLDVIFFFFFKYSSLREEKKKKGLGVSGMFLRAGVVGPGWHLRGSGYPEGITEMEA